MVVGTPAEQVLDLLHQPAFPNRCPNSRSSRVAAAGSRGKPGGRGCPLRPGSCPPLPQTPALPQPPGVPGQARGRRRPVRSPRHSPLLPTRPEPSTASLMSLGRRQSEEDSGMGASRKCPDMLGGRMDRVRPRKAPAYPAGPRPQRARLASGERTPAPEPGGRGAVSPVGF